MYLLKMKYLVLIVAIFMVQSAECEQMNKPEQSVHTVVLDYVANKTTQVKNYIITTGVGVKNTTKNAISSVSSLFSRGKKSLSDFTENNANELAKKLKDYISIAQKTAQTMYDVIAPEQVDYKYKCTNADPANDMTALELIFMHGYHAEEHTAITEDGYIITIHRIPYSRNSRQISDKTVLLQHGFLGSSIDWVIPGPKRSLPYILSEAGYDVWLSNVRGNTYSRSHIFRTIDSAAFWNFTFQDIAEYDLPAIIDFIQEYKTGNEKINFIGFSMGTTVLFAMLSTKTQYNDILRAAYTLAPLAYMKEMKSTFTILAKFGKTIDMFFKLIGANEFLPRNALVRYLAKHSCTIKDYQDAFCEMSMFLFCGEDQKHFDHSLMPIIFGHVPAGASTKTLAHFAQEIRNGGKFQKFDYGKEDNMKEYGTPTPPEYPLNKITLPIWMISAQDDHVSSLADAKCVFKELVNPVEHYIVPDKDFHHLDFLFAKDADALVYDKLMTMIEKPIFEAKKIHTDL